MRNPGRCVWLERVGWLFLAGLVTVLVFQVPQPWRGYLVGWLLFVVSAIVMAAQVIRRVGHRTSRSSSDRLPRGPQTPDIPGQWHDQDAPSERSQTRSAPGGLKIVTSGDQGGGRYTIS